MVGPFVLMSDFFRVSYADPCEICGGQGCTYTLKGKIRTSICCRDRSTGRLSSDGRGLHRTYGENRSEGLQTPPRPLSANIQRRDRVYRAMLDLLVLEDREREHLLARRLTEEHVSKLEKLGYRTTRDVAEELAGAGYELARVPGFYQEDGIWRANCRPGIFVPIRDKEGRIQALQIRRTDENPPAKYQWFSSWARIKDGKQEALSYGASSGSPVHHIKGAGKTVFVIEGALKADVASLFMRVPFLSMQGAKSGHDAIAAACLNFDEVVMAVDADFRVNDDLKRDWCRLYDEVRKRTGLVPKIALWDEKFKGLDDALIAGNTEVVLADFEETMEK
jgi:hypothetical protein